MQREIACANPAFGVIGLTAEQCSLFSGERPSSVCRIYRVGCGYGHIRKTIRKRASAINNTAVLFLDFVVPAVPTTGYLAWV